MPTVRAAKRPEAKRWHSAPGGPLQSANSFGATADQTTAVGYGATASFVASSTSIATLRQTFPTAGTFSISVQYAGDVNFQSITAAPVQDLRAYRGWFHCDDELLNRIWYAGKVSTH